MQNPFQIYGTEKIMPFFQTTYISIAYTVGNLITRTFGSIAEKRHLWLLACLQVSNCISLWVEVWHSVLPHLWQALFYSVWVGLVSGSSYLNTHYLITKQQPSGTRQFSLKFAAFGEQLALTVALIIVKPLSNYVCDLPVSRDMVRILMYHYFGWKMFLRLFTFCYNKDNTKRKLCLNSNLCTHISRNLFYQRFDLELSYK